MDANTVETMLRSAIADAQISVDGAGAKYDIRIIAELFDGMREVKRQQTVYAAIRDEIASGSIHAVNIQTFTPGEWEAKGA